MTELPVEFAKDTAAACVAELVAGRGRSIRSFLYVFVDTFIGGGLVIDSHLGLAGYASDLAEVDPVAGGGYRLGRRFALPLGPIDFPEALAVERRADGSRRLWLMTDDNFQRPFRTLLVALDWPAGA